MTQIANVSTSAPGLRDEIEGWTFEDADLLADPAVDLVAVEEGSAAMSNRCREPDWRRNERTARVAPPTKSKRIGR